MASPTKWYWEYLTPDLILLSSLREIVYTGRTRYQQVDIIETATFGRCLVLDGKTQSSEADEFIYHEALVHPSFIAHPDPRGVFIAGGGEGATLREVLKYRTIQQVVMVDLDKEVVDLCRKHLPQHHQGAFEDPRLELHHADALAFLEQGQGRYDIIVLDTPDPMEGGPAYLLYTQEFYHLVLSRLKPQGMMVVQAGSSGPTTCHESFTAIYNTVDSIFPYTFAYRAYVPSFGNDWGFVIGSLGPSPLALDPPTVDQHIARRLSHPLRYYDGITHQGSFALPKYLRDALAEEHRIITKENPLFVF